MEYFAILAIPVIALVVGYSFGKTNVDPNTTTGKLYYSKGETK